MTMTDDAAPPITSGDVCTRARVSYRQLDYWSRRGFIPNTAKGSGMPRTFTEADVEYIATFAKMVRAGLHHDKANMVMQLGLITDGRVRLNDEVVLVFEDVG